MFKKLLVASAVFAASTSVVFAGHHHNYKADYKGEAPCPTYQYIAGPYIGLSGGVRTNVVGAPAAYKGIEGTLSLGYAGMINPMFYLAGEVFVADSFTAQNYPNDLGNGGIKSSWSYGLDLIPGVMITDYVLGYARVGVVRTRFSSQNTSQTGWQVGLGGQTNIYQNWDLRGEYVYSQYSNISGVGKPSSDQFNLGVVYKFL